MRKQVDCGIDFVTDGEFSKPGLLTYIQERLAENLSDASTRPIARNPRHRLRWYV
jgi:hypothetical protein